MNCQPLDQSFDAMKEMRSIFMTLSEQNDEMLPVVSNQCRFPLQSRNYIAH